MADIRDDDDYDPDDTEPLPADVRRCKVCAVPLEEGEAEACENCVDEFCGGK